MQNYLDYFTNALSQYMNLNKEKIIATFPNGKINPLILVIDDLCTQDNIHPNSMKDFFQRNPNLGRIAGMKVSPIVDALKLYSSMHSERGDNGDEGSGFGFGKWGVNEKRAHEIYYPPKGWRGYGLTVFSRYDQGNNAWLHYEGDGVWCIAYHGVFGKNLSGLFNQIRNLDNIDLSRNDIPKVGDGFVSDPNPGNLEQTAGVIENEGKQYKVAFMLRVKPDKKRKSSQFPNYWVTKADSTEVRPYRILIKELN